MLSTHLLRLRPGTIALALLVSATLLPAVSSAQDDPATRYPLRPTAADCTVEPRSIESIVDLFANATPEAMEAPATNASIPLGRHAEEPIAAEISARIEVAFACQNAGDNARFFALLTDHALVTIFPWVAGMALDEEMAAEMIAATPLTEDFQQTILGVGGITDIGNGRYTAVVVYLDPSGGESVYALHLTFVNVDGEWLIDGVIDFQIPE